MEKDFFQAQTLGHLWLLNPAASALAAAAPNYFDGVMSTGYQDRDLISNNAENSKGMFAVHFRPNEKTEVSLTSLIGRGVLPSRI